MTAYLTFTYAASLASFGDIAVGERRSSAERPAKSAILGLVAGALGIERDEAESHSALASELFYAVRTEDMAVRSPRRLMTDYHTVQTRQRGRNIRFATRHEELADKKELETILSYREYRSDCIFTIALWPRSATLRYTLEQMQTALERPVFTPYAGRKSCPLMLPMFPRVVEASDVKAALIARDELMADIYARLEAYRLKPTKLVSLTIDADAEELHGQRREHRRDAIVNRQKWQFGLREEALVSWEGTLDE